MIGMIKQLKWTEKPESSRDLVFIILILAFGLVMVAKLAPYFKDQSKTVIYTGLETSPRTPREFVEAKAQMKLSSGAAPTRQSRGFSLFHEQGRKNMPSVIERTLFDGHSVVLKVRSLNPFSSNDSNQPLEVSVLRAVPRQNEGDIDYSPAIGAKLIGKGDANLASKRLYLNFSDLVTQDGRTYAIHAQAIDPETLSAGIDGDYSSGLPMRLLGIAIDRGINVADQLAMGHIFSGVGPEGSGGQEFKRAAMETNQQASQNIAAEATKDMRETPAEITMNANTVFHVRLKATTPGVQQ